MTPNQLLGATYYEEYSANITTRAYRIRVFP